MKNFYTLILLVPAILLIVAFTTGPDAGYSGSPLDGQNCTACHSPGPATTVSNWIVIDAGPNGYVPGETYPLTVIAQDIVAEKMGFQITSESASAKAGTWVITNTTRTQLKGGTAVTHTAAGTVPVGTPNTWSMDWTAPAEGTGAVTFYLAVNKTNADNTNQGDEIFVSSLTIQESNVGIAELDDRIGTLYPNPASNVVRLDVPVSSRIAIYDNTGRTIMSFLAANETEEIDVSAFRQGLYFVNISLEGQTASRTFVKR